MKSSSESILSVVAAGVARSKAFCLTGTFRSTVVKRESRRRGGSREIDEDRPVAIRERGSGPLVAEELSESEIAASAAFLFLVVGGVVKALWQATGVC